MYLPNTVLIHTIIRYYNNRYFVKAFQYFFKQRASPPNAQGGGHGGRRRPGTMRPATLPDLRRSGRVLEVCQRPLRHVVGDRRRRHVRQLELHSSSVDSIVARRSSRDHLPRRLPATRPEDQVLYPTFVLRYHRKRRRRRRRRRGRRTQDTEIDAGDVDGIHGRIQRVEDGGFRRKNLSTRPVLSPRR